MMKHSPIGESEQQELREQVGLADAGEASGVLLHELGNLLNNLLLDARLMQRDLPEQYHERIAGWCHLITVAAQQMKQLAQYRQLCVQHPYPVDLPDVLRQVVDEQEPHLDLSADTDDQPMFVTTTRTDLKRALRLLLRNVLRLQDNAEPLHIELSRQGNEAHLLLRVDGPQLTADQMPILFEPFRELPSDWNGLEAACALNLFRRMGGRLTVQNGEHGKITFTAIFPCRKDN